MPLRCMFGWLCRYFHRSRSKGREHPSHQIIVNDELDYLLWPVGSSLPPNWRYFGEPGSEVELKEYMREVLAETSPAPLVVSDRDKNV